MSIIEQAAKRLEELRRAGIDPRPAKDVNAEDATVLRPRHEPGVIDLSRPTAPQVALGLVAPGRVQSGLAARNDAPFAPPQRESRQVGIDLARLSSMGFLTANGKPARLADEYRVIKRPLLTNALQKSPTRVALGNLIMVTSAVPGEGKTYTAINLALSMAMEHDSTVLLVDADVARPSVLDRLGLPSSKGLLDLLTEPGLELADVMLRTNIDRLSILPAGSHHSRATELLASDGMNRLIEELTGRYDDRILVFDAPPLLPSTESRVLATHMGQVVVVVEAARTQRSLLVQALGTLESCPVVMTLLNKVASADVGSYNYGYYVNARD